MTKTSKYHFIPLNLSIDPETKYKILALAYLKQQNERLTKLARNLLYKGVEAMIEGLSDQERTDYEEILKSVRVRDVMEHLNVPPD